MEKDEKLMEKQVKRWEKVILLFGTQRNEETYQEKTEGGTDKGTFEDSWTNYL